MTTDNSPGLGGHSDDLSPMISSVVTRVVVSARGAYTVGNLEGLIKHMTDEQRLAFKVAIVRQIIGVFEAEIVDHAEHRDAIVLDVLADINCWLETPSDSNAARLFTNFTVLEDSDFLEYGIKRVIYGIKHEEPDFPYSMWGIIGEYYSIESIVHKAVLYALGIEWQLEAAWALLRDVPLPPAPQTDTDTLERLSQDAQWCFQQRDLVLLVRLLSPEQQSMFKTMVLQQAMWIIEHRSPDWCQSPTDLYWIEQAKHWLSHPESLTLEGHQEAVEAVQADYRNKSVTHRAIRLLIQAFDAHHSPDNFWQDYAGAVCTLAGYTTHSEHGFGPNSSRRSDEVRQWQIEVAWAMYNHAPLPPFLTGE
jgi:hypothetical protein